MPLLKVYRIVFFLLLILIASSCKKNPPVKQDPYQLEIPPGFPSPEIPEDNPLTVQKIRLGKKLFFEPLLSADSSVSCSSCHLQDAAFSDSRQFSIGSNGAFGIRNAPSLANIAYSKHLLRDGGTISLELQVLAPLDNPDEMNMTLPDVINRLKNDPEYVNLFREAFDREVDGFGMIRAIAAYERTMISGNSDYDRYTFQNDTGALSESGKRGLKLFNSYQLNCSSCHTGFNFSDDAFHNNGLYKEYTDKGRGRITFKEEDNGKYRTMTLRNIELTAPYMHDGSLNNLGEVIEHYAKGGEGHPNQSAIITGFQITNSELSDLVEFLKSLTDPSFINNPDFRQ